MTDDSKLTLTITSPEEFETALAAVVETAVSADVDVRGAWEFRTDDSATDWEVKITELAKRRNDDSDHAES